MKTWPIVIKRAGSDHPEFKRTSLVLKESQLVMYCEGSVYPTICTFDHAFSRYSALLTDVFNINSVCL